MTSVIPPQLDYLAVAPRWVYWRYETRKGKRTKVPYSINGREVNVHDPVDLSPAPTVARNGIDGIGLVFLPDQPEKGIDLDACIRADKSLEPWAAEIIEHLDSYTEISPSGIGLKVFFTAPSTISGSRKSVKWPSSSDLKEHEIAYYQAGYFTVTAKVWRDRPVRKVDESTVQWILECIETRRKSIRTPESQGPGPSDRGMPILSARKYSTLPASLRRLIETGAPEGSRSEKFHHVVCWMADEGWTPEETSDVLHAHPDGIAEKYVNRLPTEIRRSLGKRKPLDLEKAAHLPSQFNGDIHSLFFDLILTEDDVQKMADAEFLIPNMIVRGHVAAYVAPANGGKTTIFIHLCERLVKMGMTVLYINADGSPGDLKRHYEHAQRHGYKVIAPDAKNGKSTQDVMVRLEAVASAATRCDEFVFIVDTLKKFTDVIDKRQAKAFFKLMRTITVKGATICLLGHVNKYAGEDGKTIFEGTGDLRNDLDELIYLDVFKNEGSNTLEVTTRPDKVRAEFKPKSFLIHLDDGRHVSEPDIAIRILPPEERHLLDAIKTAIQDGHHTQKDIVSSVKQTTPHGDRKIRAALLKHSQEPNQEIEVKRSGRATDLHYSISEPAMFEELVDDLI